MKNIFLNGLNSIAPTELNKSIIQPFYYDIAPEEQKHGLKNQIDPLVYELYGFTKEEIKIV